MMLNSWLVLTCCLVVTAMADNANHAHHGDPDHYHAHYQPVAGFNSRLSFGNNNNNAGGGGGYGAPSGGYGAPSGDYGAPASGYGAPATGYGGGGGGYDAPVYVQTTAGGGLGGLLGLLPLGALALAIPLGLLALTLPVTTTIIGGRKKRDADGVMRSNMTLVEKQAELLRTYLDTHGLDHDTALQRDMIARYLECGGGGASELVSQCLERLTCLTHDRKVRLPARDMEVATIILETILENEFLSAAYKKRLLEAGQTGHAYPGSCHKYRCDQQIFGHTKPMKYRKLSETLSNTVKN